MELNNQRDQIAREARERINAYINREAVATVVYISGEPVEESGEGVESK